MLKQEKRGRGGERAPRRGMRSICMMYPSLVVTMWGSVGYLRRHSDCCCRPRRSDRARAGGRSGPCLPCPAAHVMAASDDSA